MSIKYTIGGKASDTGSGVGYLPQRRVASKVTVHKKYSEEKRYYEEEININAYDSRYDIESGGMRK